MPSSPIYSSSSGTLCSINGAMLQQDVRIGANNKGLEAAG